MPFLRSWETTGGTETTGRIEGENPAALELTAFFIKCVTGAGETGEGGERVTRIEGRGTTSEILVALYERRPLREKGLWGGSDNKCGLRNLCTYSTFSSPISSLQGFVTGSLVCCFTWPGLPHKTDYFDHPFSSRRCDFEPCDGPVAVSLLTSIFGLIMRSLSRSEAVQRTQGSSGVRGLLQDPPSPASRPATAPSGSPGRRHMEAVRHCSLLPALCSVLLDLDSEEKHADTCSVRVLFRLHHSAICLVNIAMVLTSPCSSFAHLSSHVRHSAQACCPIC